MSDKQRLQVNNTNLSTILSKIGDLPLKALVEAAAKNGKYVWKKFDKPPTYDTGIIVTQTAAVTWQITSNVIDISQIDVSFFDGEEFVRSDGWRMKFDSGGTHMVLYDSGGASNGGGTVTYTNGIMKVTGYGYTHLNTIYNWTAEIIKDQSQTELGYVVNDSETAYPDGGMKDGYWYERGEGLSAESFGFSKVAAGSFTVASRTSAPNVTMEHGLGETPKVVMIYAGECTSGSNGDINCIILDTVASQHESTQNYKGAECNYNSSYTSTRGSVFPSSLNFTNSNMVYNASSRYFRAGVQYNWIAMA